MSMKQKDLNLSYVLASTSSNMATKMYVYRYIVYITMNIQMYTYTVFMYSSRSSMNGQNGPRPSFYINREEIEASPGYPQTDEVVYCVVGRSVIDAIHS